MYSGVVPPEGVNLVAVKMVFPYLISTIDARSRAVVSSRICIPYSVFSLFPIYLHIASMEHYSTELLRL